MEASEPRGVPITDPPQLQVLAHEPPDETAVSVYCQGKHVLTLWDGDRQRQVAPEFEGNDDLVTQALEAAHLAISMRQLVD